MNTKVALVTGASRGIGRAIALELATRGYRVAVNYPDNQQNAEEVVKEIKAFGQQAIAVKADVSNETDVKNMVKTVIKQWGSLDVLVNNAGINRDNILMRKKEEEFKQIINTNLKGTLLRIKELSRNMQN